MEETLFIQHTSNEQREFLKSINIDINLTLDEIEEAIYEYMQLNGFDDDELNEIGLKCEEILDILSNI